jgi:hypothetical protein
MDCKNGTLSGKKEREIVRARVRVGLRVRVRLVGLG